MWFRVNKESHKHLAVNTSNCTWPENTEVLPNTGEYGPKALHSCSCLHRLGCFPINSRAPKGPGAVFEEPYRSPTSTHSRLPSLSQQRLGFQAWPTSVSVHSQVDTTWFKEPLHSHICLGWGISDSLFGECQSSVLLSGGSWLIKASKLEAQWLCV